MELGNSDIVIFASVGVIIVAFTLWRVLYVSPNEKDGDFLTDGAVLMISDGLVKQASVEARDLLGDCEQSPIVTVLDQFLRRGSADVRDSVNRLEMTGEPVNLLVYNQDNRAFELIGAPAGGMIRLILRDAGFLDTRLKAAEERLNAADALVQDQNWERTTLRNLVDEAPIIVWNRSEDGTLNWADGQIRTRSSTVTADHAVDIIIARTRLNTQPALAGQPQKSRIELIVNDGAETISLQVIEIIRPNGDRIGFATDAGTAASAERTLTRFVQTMTETFAHLTVGLAIFDRNQTLALFNPALVQMWQLEPAWLARRPSLRDVVDELRASRRLPELQDFHKWREELLGLFDNTEAADYEELWHLSNGSNIRVLARPHPHGSLAFIFDDVTERMRLEQRYRHSIDLRRVTLDRLNEGIAVFGSNGLLQFINQAFHEIWGTNSEDVYAAMHVRQFIPLCQNLSPEKDVWKGLHSFVTGEHNRREWEARVSTHSGHVLNARFVPLPDGSTMAVFTDITDTAQVARKFSERSFSLKFTLAARDYIAECIDREVRPPLAEFRERTRTTGENDSDFTDLAAEAGDALDRMEELSDLLKLTEETDDPALEDQELGSILKTVGGILETAASDADIKLNVALPPELTGVSANRYHTLRIAFSAGLFAIERFSSGSSVALSAESDEDGYGILVTVSGHQFDGGTSSSAGRDRAVLEHLVANRNGVLSVSETKATGEARIVARFDRASAEKTDSEPFVESSDSHDQSNILHLPSVASRD